MPLELVEEGLPEELKSQMLPKEEVHYFSFLSGKGGCLSNSSREEYWIALTNKRVIYQTTVIEVENNKTKSVEKHGVLPMDKVSFVEVTDNKERDGCGCNSTQYYELRISTSGGTIRIPLKSKEKGIEIRAIYSEIIETHYSSKQETKRRKDD